jgi:hypothetical protein
VILPALGKLPLGRLDAATLDAFYAQLRKQGGKGPADGGQQRPSGPRDPVGSPRPRGRLGMDRPESGPARHTALGREGRRRPASR